PAKHIPSPPSEDEEGSDQAAEQSEPEGESQEPQEERAANDAGDGSGSVPSRYFGNYVKRGSRLSELFDRVNTLLGSNNQDAGEAFRPKAPETLDETGLTFEEVERLILKFLLAKGSARGRAIANQVRMPFQIIDPILKQCKQEQLLAFKGAAE